MKQSLRRFTAILLVAMLFASAMPMDALAAVNGTAGFSISKYLAGDSNGSLVIDVVFFTLDGYSRNDLNKDTTLTVTSKEWQKLSDVITVPQGYSFNKVLTGSTLYAQQYDITHIRVNPDNDRRLQRLNVTSGEPSSSDGKNINNSYSLYVLVDEISTSVTINGAKEVYAGQSTALNATVVGLSSQGVTWTSSDDTTATVDQNGNVTGLKSGKVTITATSTDDASVYGTHDFTVKSIPASISVTGSDKVEINTSTQLQASVLPDGGEVVWSSSDENIATVDGNGKVTARALGNVTITAASKDFPEVKGSIDMQVTGPLCTVSFQLNGGTGTAPVTISAEAGDVIILPSADGFQRENYVFIYWSESPNANTALNQATQPSKNPAGSQYRVSDDVTLYAIWAQVSGNVSTGSNNQLYIAIRNDGVVPSEPAVYGADPYTFIYQNRVNNIITYINPARTVAGVSAVKRCLTSQFDALVSRYIKDYFENFDENTQYVEFYVIKYQTGSGAGWHVDGVIRNRNLLYLDYNGNGYTNGLVPEGYQVEAGKTYTVSKPGAYQNNISHSNWLDMVRSGYEFTGWNTKADGSGTWYQPDSNITIGDESVTLYAQWKTLGLEIASGSQSWEFDGQPHTYTEYTVSYNGSDIDKNADGTFTLSTGDIVTVTPGNDISVTNVSEGKKDNAFTYTITNDGNVVSGRYQSITKTFGKVWINAKDLTITVTDTKPYDGSALVTAYNATGKVTASGLVAGDRLTAGALTTDDSAPATYVYPNITGKPQSSITTSFATSKGIGNYSVAYAVSQTIENQLSYTVRYYKDSVDNTTVVGDGKNFLGSASVSIAYEDTATVAGGTAEGQLNWKKPEAGYENGVQQGSAPIITLNGTVVNVLYTKISLSYTVQYYKGEVTSVTDTDHYLGYATNPISYGEKISENDIALDEKQPAQYYRDGAVQNKDIFDVTIIDGNAVVIVLYPEMTSTIKYVAVTTDMGSVSEDKEDLGLVTGKVQGSTAAPNDTYKFMGWYTDKACTTSVDTKWVKDNTLTPDKPMMDGAEVTYYAKFLTAVGVAPSEGFALNTSDAVASSSDSVGIPVGYTITAQSVAAVNANGALKDYGVFSLDNGELVFTQTKAYPHADGENMKAEVFDIAVTVLDANTNEATWNGKVTIADDEPSISVTALGENVTSGSSKSGTWTYSFNADTDDMSNIGVATGEGQTYTFFGSDESIKITGTNGDLTVNKDMTYTYSANAGATAQQTEKFRFRITDADGTTRDAELSVTVVPRSDLAYTVRYYKDSVDNTTTVGEGNFLGEKTYTDITYGTEVTLLENDTEGQLNWKKPEAGYENGEQQGDAPFVVVTEDSIINVVYLQQTVQIAYVSEDDSKGTVTSSSEKVDAVTGKPKGSTAEPTNNYAFVNWTLNTNSEYTSDSETLAPSIKDAGSDTKIWTERTYTAHFTNAAAILNLGKLEAENDTLTVYEKNLLAGSYADANALTKTGSFIANFDKQGGEITIGEGANKIVITVDTENKGTFTSGSITEEGKYTFTVTEVSPYTENGISAGTKVTFTYTLDGNQAHDTGKNDSTLYNDFAVALVSSNTNVNDANGKIRVTVYDDIPSIDVGAAITNLPSGTEKTGTWTRNFGADVPANQSIALSGTFSGTYKDVTLALSNASSASIEGTYGTLTVNADGTYVYMADPNAEGEDSFTFTITDADGDSKADILSIGVVNSTVTPEAVRFETSDAILRDNKTDADSVAIPTGVTLTQNAVGTVNDGIKYGAFSINNGELVFTQSAVYAHGAEETSHEFDAVSFAVTDANGNATTWTATVTILDDAPTANDDELILTELQAQANAVGMNALTDTNAVVGVYMPGADEPGADTPITVIRARLDGAVTDTVLDNGAVTITGVYGNLKLSEDGSYEYVLKLDSETNMPVDIFNNTAIDTFWYTIQDNDGDTSEAKIIITIKPDSNVPKKPIVPAVGGDYAKVKEKGLTDPNDASETVSGEIIVTPNGENLTVTIGNAAFSLDKAGNLIGELPVGGAQIATKCRSTLTITSIVEGKISYTYTLMKAQTHTPGYGDNTDFGSTFNDYITISVVDQTYDGNSETLAILIVDDQPSINAYDPTQSVGTGSSISGKWTYDFGADGSNGEPLPAPTGSPSEYKKTIDVSNAVTKDTKELSLSDDDDVEIIVNGEYGKLTVKADGTYTYAANPNVGTFDESKFDEFTFSITDHDWDTATDSLQIKRVNGTVKPKDATLRTSDADVLADGMDTATSVIPTGYKLEQAAVDDVNDDVTYGEFSIDNGELVFTQRAAYTHAVGETSHEFEAVMFDVTDANGNATKWDVKITIDDTDPTISVVGLNASVDSGTSETGTWTRDFGADVPANQSIAINETELSLTQGGSVNVSGTYGTLTVNADGTYTYTAKTNSEGTDAFAFSIADTDGDSASASIEVNVADSTVTPNGTTFETSDANVGENETDADSAAIPTGIGLTQDAVDAVNADVTYGAFSINNGELVFTQSAAYAHGAEETSHEFEAVTFDVTDANGNATTWTATVTIEDAAPEAQDETENTQRGLTEPVSVYVLSNDTFGADGRSAAEGFVFTGDTDAVPTDDGIAIQGLYGVLTVRTDGEGEYALDETNPAVIALADGQTLSDTFDYRIADADGDIATATLTIAIQGANTFSLETLKSVTSTDADADGLYELNETITYNVVVTNTGNTVASSLNVADSLQGIVLEAGAAEMTAENLLPGQSVTFTYTYQVTEADILAGQVNNVATASGIGPDGEIITPAESTEVIVLTEEANAAWDVEKTVTSVPANGAAYVAGETMTFDIVVTNTGNVTLANMQVRELMLDATILEGEGYTVENNIATIAALAPDADAPFTVKASYLVKDTDIGRGDLVNVATATTETKPDEEVIGETDPIETAGMTAVKTETSVPANAEGYLVGEAILFDIAVTNTGTLELTNLQVSEALEGARLLPGDGYTIDGTTATVAILPAGETVVLKADYVVKEGDADTELRNSVMVTSNEGLSSSPQTDPLPVLTQYSVLYDANGGEGEVPVDAGRYNEGYMVDLLFAPTPTMIGNVFLGWSEDPAATEATYSEGGTTTLTMGNADTTLYAIYGPDDFAYTVRYYADAVDDANLLGEMTYVAPFGATVDATELDLYLPLHYGAAAASTGPITVTEVPEANVINVVYLPILYGYSVEYYYDEELAADATVFGTALFGTTINAYADKARANYRLDRVEGLPLTVGDTPAANVIRVYYEWVEPLALIIDIETPLAANTASLNVGDCIE